MKNETEIDKSKSLFSHVSLRWDDSRSQFNVHVINYKHLYKTICLVQSKGVLK